jgi:putative peptide zinc metalloprotease protein
MPFCAGRSSHCVILRGSEMSAENLDFDLPALNPLIKLYPGTPSSDGTPRWTIHHPVSNKYYQLGWAEFECLARFNQCKTAIELLRKLETETTLRPDFKDIQNLVIFLQTNGLLVSTDQKLSIDAQAKAAKTQPLWKKALHGYLYFTIPLVRPEAFLKRTLPYVEPLFSREAFYIFSALMIVGIVLTLQRLDEFFHTFTQFFTIEGVITTFIVFTTIKILHELGHAYTAIRNGVSVPHMGLAFIVMYPVLYTETTGAWQISSKKKRMQIGLAGVAVELAIAAIFIALWHLLPPGAGRSISFSVIAVSLIGSLLVNLNPLMRFDGYYVLSDYTGIENLHQKALAFARWKIRKILFGLRDSAPYQYAAKRAEMLTVFGMIILVYRFFLFIGIALLVYHLFFKPVGLILMLVEIIVFIVLPIISELRVWMRRRTEILQHRRAKISLGIMVLLLAAFVLPIESRINVPAVAHAKFYRAIYPPAPAFIVELNVSEGQSVAEGDVLVRLLSPELETAWLKSKARLEDLQSLKQRAQTDIALYRERAGKLEGEIEIVRKEVEALTAKKQSLIVTAPFAGSVRDLDVDIAAGRAIAENELLLRLVNDSSQSITAYIRERDLGRIKIGSPAVFRPSFSPFANMHGTVQSIETVNTQTLAWPELASIYGGSLPSARHDQNTIVSLEPLYAVHIDLLQNNKQNQLVIEKGVARISATYGSRLFGLIQNFFALVMRESGYD